MTTAPPLLVIYQGNPSQHADNAESVSYMMTLPIHFYENIPGYVCGYFQGAQLTSAETHSYFGMSVYHVLRDKC